MADILTFQQVYDELRPRGVVLKKAPAEYRLHYAGDTEPRRITDNLEDALEIGLEMIAFAIRKPPPLGPMGKRTRKGDMYQHNRRLAKRRGYL